jgi:predicted SprT family Zn-dependent metalloprotease
MIKNDVKAIIKNAYSILEENGFYNCTVKINPRLTRAMGRAWRKEIELSKQFAEYGRLNMIEWVIKHEVAHLIDKRNRFDSRHDSIFASIARRIGTPLTGATTKDLEVYREGFVDAGEKMKYRGVCPVCGKVTMKRNKPRNLRSCGKCSPNVFSYNYIIEYTRVY